jgi:hypothetical protein
VASTEKIVATALDEAHEGMHAFGEKQRSAGVPQIVEAEGVGETGLIEQRLERAGAHIGAVRRDSCLRGEDQVLILQHPR